MEEKLYFKPANYGKGKKKEQTEQKSEPKTEKNHKALKLVIVLLALVIIVAVIIWLLRGKTTTTGQYPANIRTDSLECTSNKLDYEKIGTLNIITIKKELELKLLFSSNDELKSINLKNFLTFDTAKEATSAEAIAHAAFNKGLSAKGYNSEQFENKFTLMDNQLVLTIHNDSQLNENSKDYFLLAPEESPNTLHEFQKIYESKGFTCKSTQENN
ncbi:hypothetical protein IKF74_01445 [Candidatus Saccharibacteria bacterium]|nr:hypothetical protein [Candidatus Saccharibacteria bacterium]